MDRLVVSIPYLLPVAEFNWGIFIPRVAIATMVFVFALAWSAWLWFIVCRPGLWAAWVQREHHVMRRWGVPARVAHWMYYVQTRWPMPLIMGVTIVLAIAVLRAI